MPSSLGPMEILVILVVALIVLGPNKLPQAGRQVGKALAEMRRWTNEVRSEVTTAFDTSAVTPDPTPAATPAPQPAPSPAAIDPAAATESPQPYAAVPPEPGTVPSPSQSPATLPEPISPPHPIWAAQPHAPSAGQSAQEAPAGDGEQA